MRSDPASSRSRTPFALLKLLFVATAIALNSGAASAQNSQPAQPDKLAFPRVIKIRYQATDPRAGGQFIIWVEREKIFYGLDPKLYPAAEAVEVTYITPAPGTTTITLISVIPINSKTPDYFHLSGNTRFKISRMKIVSSNVPDAFPSAPADNQVIPP